MNLSALEKMSTESLILIRDHCAELVKNRADARLRIGAIVTFKDQNGTVHCMRVVRVNAKTVTTKAVDPVTHLDLSSARGLHWRISPNLLHVVPGAGTNAHTRVQAPPAAEPAKYVPTTSAGAEVW